MKMDYNTLRIKPTINLPCDYDEEAERNGKVTCKDLLSSTLTGIFTEIELPLNAITVKSLTTRKRGRKQKKR